MGGYNMAASVYNSPVFFDARGYFQELFTSNQMKQYEKGFDNFQVNLSKSNKGVIRGLHFNSRPTYKFVRCIDGEILDCVLSVNPAYKDYGSVQIFQLSSLNSQILMVPPGHAHGFQVLSTTATVIYFVNQTFDFTDDFGINALDQDLKIQWKELDIINMSDKDKTLQNWREFKPSNYFGGLE